LRDPNREGETYACWVQNENLSQSSPFVLCQAEPAEVGSFF
jgi:hypothetical protein